MTAAEAVETAIRRAEAHQGTLNFIVNSDFDRALAKARAGTPAGPFGGLPFLIKDIDDYVEACRRGLAPRPGRFAPAAKEQIRFSSAPSTELGVIVIGKSATPGKRRFCTTTEPPRDRRNAQSLGSGALLRRVFGRNGGGRSCRNCRGWRSDRWRRIDPHPRLALRPLWAEALPRADDRYDGRDEDHRLRGATRPDPQRARLCGLLCSH